MEALLAQLRHLGMVDGRTGPSCQREAALGREEDGAILLRLDLSRSNRALVAQARHAVVKGFAGVGSCEKGAVHVRDDEVGAHGLLCGADRTADQDASKESAAGRRRPQRIDVCEDIWVAGDNAGHLERVLNRCAG